jgi:hypothetical protein
LEYDGEEFRNEIVEFPAFAGIAEFGAICTAFVPVFDVAGTNLTPRRLIIFMASGAFLLQVSFAGTAVQSATGNEFRVLYDLFHDSLIKNLSI